VIREIFQRIRPGVLALAFLALSAATLSAQEEDLLSLRLLSGGGVEVRLGDIFDAGGTRESLESGLPLRIRVVTELWRDRLFDSQVGREEWRATVWFDPLSTTYRVETEEVPVGTAETPEVALQLLQSEIGSDLRPDQRGRYYYLARMEVETLSLSDLEELRRWLRGELAPAVDGNEAVGGALGRGIRRLFVRALSLPAIQSQSRTPRFDWEP
jgi:Domain of unknown function (DUF4390)